MSCIVLDIELPDKNIIRELGDFLMVNFRDIHLFLQKSTKSNRFGVQETCTEYSGTVDVRVAVSFQTFFLEP